MDHFTLLILASLPLAAPTPPPHDRSVFPTLSGCEAAASTPPGCGWSAYR